MLRFAVISEGPTDQRVIENILWGYFDEPAVNAFHPPPGGPGGWLRVIRAVESGAHRRALENNEYVVIHIDTDVSQDPGFHVPHQEGNHTLSVEQLTERVISRLLGLMDAPFIEKHGHRVIFAVAVHSIECWFLPLLYQDAKAAKPVGCLRAVNNALKKLNQDSLSPGEDKAPRRNDEVSRAFLKRKDLLDAPERNPSLGEFIKRLPSAV